MTLLLILDTHPSQTLYPSRLHTRVCRYVSSRHSLSSPLSHYHSLIILSFSFSSSHPHTHPLSLSVSHTINDLQKRMFNPNSRIVTSGPAAHRRLTGRLHTKSKDDAVDTPVSTSACVWNLAPGGDHVSICTTDHVTLISAGWRF